MRSNCRACTSIVSMHDRRASSRRRCATGMQKKWLQWTRSTRAASAVRRQLGAFRETLAHRRAVAVPVGDDEPRKNPGVKKARDRTRRRNSAACVPFRASAAGIRPTATTRREARLVVAGDREDLGAQRAIGFDLADIDLVGAAGMPGRMHDGDGAAGEGALGAMADRAGLGQGCRVQAYCLGRRVCERGMRRAGDWCRALLGPTGQVGTAVLPDHQLTFRAA